MLGSGRGTGSRSAPAGTAPGRLGTSWTPGSLPGLDSPLEGYRQPAYTIGVQAERRRSPRSQLVAELERLDVDARRALRVTHVRSDALRLRRDVPLGEPGRRLRDLRVLEFVEREIGRRARHGTEAPPAYDAGDLLVVRNVDRVVPGVEVGVDLRRHVHPPELQRRRHRAVGHLRGHALGMDERIDVADEVGPDDLRRALLGPRRRVGANALVGVGLQRRDALELIDGQMPGSALDRFVPRAVQESRQLETLGQMLLVVPAVELLLLVRRNIGPDHHEPRALLGRHAWLLSRTRS